MKFRTLMILVISILGVVNCDDDKNRIQKRSDYHHHHQPEAFNDLHYHTPGAFPFAHNPLLFKAPAFGLGHSHVLPAAHAPAFGLGHSHVLPAAPAPVYPGPKFVPGDAWVTQHSATYPRFPVLQPPVIPTAPLLPAAPPVFHAVKPFAFAPPAVNYIPVNPVIKPVVFAPRPVFAQPTFVPTAVAVRPIVPILPPHHHHHHQHVPVQPTVSSENPENPPINTPDQPNTSNEIDETDMSQVSPDNPQSTHNTIPLLPAGLPPTFVMQIGTSSSGFDASTFAQSPSPSAQPSFNPGPFAPHAPPSSAFGGLVPQMMWMQMMQNNNNQHVPEQENFNFHPQSSYGPPQTNYGPPMRPHQKYHHHRPTPKRLRQRPNMHHRKPHRHSKKLKYTIIKHHHDRK